jgi:hypothetical protein
MSSKGADGLAATIPAALDSPGVFSTEPELLALCGYFVGELSDLKERSEALAPRDRTVAAGPASFDVAERYATVLAASACLGVWRHNQDQPSVFLRDTPWITAVLRRLAHRLGAATAIGAGGGLDQSLFAELRARHTGVRAFDLTAGRLVA